MRWTVLAAVGAALAAALLATACSGAVPAAGPLTARATTTAGAPATGQQATPEGCYAFAVTALRQHVIVRHVPPVCAGLGAQQVNLTIARAIYRGRVCQYPSRLVMLRDRTRVLARSDRPETTP